MLPNPDSIVLVKPVPHRHTQPRIGRNSVVTAAQGESFVRVKFKRTANYREARR